jgi:hypothetical protein
MSSHVYCSECGTKLKIYRKALPKYATIIDIVEPHICPDEPIELDLKPVPIATLVNPPQEGKFVQKLHELPTEDKTLRDRRPKDQVKSAVPTGILDAIRNSPETLEDMEEPPDKKEE